jgi:hypothetical protein
VIKWIRIRCGFELMLVLAPLEHRMYFKISCLIFIDNESCLEYSTTRIYALNRVLRHDDVYWSACIAPRVLTSILDETTGYLQFSTLYSQGKRRRYLLNWRQRGSQSRYWHCGVENALPGIKLGTHSQLPFTTPSRLHLPVKVNLLFGELVH